MFHSVVLAKGFFLVKTNSTKVKDMKVNTKCNMNMSLDGTKIKDERGHYLPI